MKKTNKLGGFSLPNNIKLKRGDLLNAEEKIIAHQVNCLGAAGGLAAYVFEKWPYARKDYEDWVFRIRKQGSVGWPLGMAQLTGQQKDGHIIANLYGQYNPGQDYRPDALRAALTMLGDQARALNAGVALPYKLSCGICGGDWEEVLGIIADTMKGVECAIYKRDEDI